MATTGILVRRNLKVNLIADPPLVGEIVYALDTNEHGWLEVDVNGNTSIKWGNLIDKAVISEGSVLRLNTKANFQSLTSQDVEGKVLAGEMVYATDTGEHAWINQVGTLIFKDLSQDFTVEGNAVDIDNTNFGGNLIEMKDVDGSGVLIHPQTAQAALEIIDNLASLSVSAGQSTVDKTNLVTNLGALGNSPSVQEALEIIDDLPLGGLSPIITDDFNKNLSITEDTVQKAFNAIDNLVIPTSASDMIVNSASFDRNLVGMDVDPTIQEALEILDDLIFEFPIDTVAFSGNLAGNTVTGVQALANAVDGLALGQDNEDWNPGGNSFTGRLSGVTTQNEAFEVLDNLLTADDLHAEAYTDATKNLTITDTTLQAVADKFYNYTPTFTAFDGNGNLSATATTFGELVTEINALVIGENNEVYGTVPFDGKLTGLSTMDSILEAVDNFDFNETLDATAFSGNLNSSDTSTQSLANKFDAAVLGELNEVYGTVPFDGKLTGLSTMDSILEAVDNFDFADALDTTANTTLSSTATTLQDLNDSVESISTIDPSAFGGNLQNQLTLTTLQNLADSVDSLKEKVTASGYTRHLTSASDLNFQEVADIVDTMPQGTTDTALNIPLTANIGDIFFDSTDGKPYWFNGTVWIDSAGSTHA